MASPLQCSIVALLLLFCLRSSSAQLSTNFYSTSCPNVLSTVRSVVQSAISSERRMGASLLRLFFHDCFVNGCDASLLLDDTSNDTPNFTGEKNAIPNRNSARGFEVIDRIKTAVEKACPGVVSCADILAITARDSVVTLGGPNWPVKLGRRDSRTASQGAANNNIPPATSSLSNLISSFSAQGLSAKDMVALVGAHTIGQARCTNFRARIYNESNIDPSFAQLRRSSCPRSSGDNNLAPLDLQTPTNFDNNYYKNLVSLKGLLHSDQQIYSNGSTFFNSQVQSYATNPGSFSSDFVAAIIKMGDINPLTGSNGEIRKNCRKTN
ncbi:peroxidase P7-like isoform X1 [Phalaenopsis equestris]|uniref:peroxidase P7-like isoform X1 n=1 Tax=Phalaenopsis equestris TaxID=78828 RepID=UPI0009E414B0|nr:peroxidase P7-like isoform X1 [Phalaenopsis equestris]